jgi:hypothetical protein
MNYLIVFIAVMSLVACETKEAPRFPVPVEYSDVSGRTMVQCPVQGGRTAFIYVFGQSNSANSGEHKYDNSDPRIMSYYEGACYIAKDPMLGATNTGGSNWIPFAENLIAAGKFDRVVFVTAGYGGARISQWAPGGDLHHDRLVSRISGVPFDFTHAIWVQGEAERDNTADKYAERLSQIIDVFMGEHQNAKFYLTLTSLCGQHAAMESIRQAQSSAVNGQDVFLGLDTDNDIDPSMRQADGCHYNQTGQETFAELMTDSF